VTSSLALDQETNNCHNCGAAVSYHYCAVCGQETRLHVPSAGEFIHEFVGHYVALEGRLWKTIYFLLRKPGFLSAEYVDGRRKRYVEPLRVYLTFSILFFAILKLMGPPVVQADLPAPQAASVEHAAQVRKQSASLIQLDPGNDVKVLTNVPGVGPKINAFLAKPGSEQLKAFAAAFFAYVPYAMFLLMPLFALYLKLLYLGSGRRYGEHLLFALHTNAFAFAMFGLMIVAGALGLDFVVFLLALWLIAYLPIAMRRVFGGALWATCLRWIVLVTAHMLSMAAAILSAFGLAILG
jgi:hypothetical protein